MEEEEEIEERKSRFYVVRTIVGQERNAADMLSARAAKEKAEIYSILATPELRGYIIVEASEKREFEKAIRNLAHIKGIVTGEMEINEIERFLEPRSPITKVSVGDIVEFTAGPFKGSRAKIVKIDKAKEEVTVVLFEATVPIPVTVNVGDIKVIKKEGE